MPAPKVRLGDTVLVTQYLLEPTEPHSDILSPPPRKYRVVPAIVVGFNADDTIDVQVIPRAEGGVAFASRVPYNADDQEAGTWRPRQ